MSGPLFYVQRKIDLEKADLGQYKADTARIIREDAQQIPTQQKIAVLAVWPQTVGNPATVKGIQENVALVANEPSRIVTLFLLATRKGEMVWKFSDVFDFAGFQE